MDWHQPSRRAFLTSSLHALGGGWLALYLPEIEAARAWALKALEAGAALQTLTAHEARTLAAMAERILPSEGGIGAREAGVVPFMDRAVGSFFGFMLEGLREGVPELDRRAAAAHGARTFADLDPAAQDDLLREIEETAFFGNVRLLTIAAVFSDPSYGGNRNDAGSKLLGIERHGAYQPPFGYYDAEFIRAGGGTR